MLTPFEQRVYERLATPQKIQDYLDTLPINFEMQGKKSVETYMSPRRTLAKKSAHCLEGALLASAILAYHGQRPLLMDLRTIAADEDHVVALFRKGGHWGAISKTNHTMLRYRDPIYTSVRELAVSYFHEYLLWPSGKKSLVSYSGPFDMRNYAPQKWVTATEDLFWLVDALDGARHFPIVPKKNRHLLRRGAKVELRAMDIVEWKPPRGFQH